MYAWMRDFFRLVLLNLLIHACMCDADLVVVMVSVRVEEVICYNLGYISFIVFGRECSQRLRQSLQLL